VRNLQRIIIWFLLNIIFFFISNFMQCIKETFNKNKENLKKKKKKLQSKKEEKKNVANTIVCIMFFIIKTINFDLIDTELRLN
jgi:Na+/H+ antiporter NhaC